MARSLHRARRWPLAAAAATALVLLLLGWGESRGWPWLIAPLAHRASQHLGLAVTLDGGAGGGAGTVRFLGPLRLALPHLKVAAADWSREDHLLDARGLVLEMRYADLWRAWRGGRLRVQRLQADALDVAAERLADGRVSWRAGPVPAAAAASAPNRLPSFGGLSIADSRLRWRDALLDSEGQARVVWRDAAGPAAVMQATATGRWRGDPLKAELSATRAAPRAGTAERTAISTTTTTATAATAATVAARDDLPLALTLSATVGRAELHFEGRASDALQPSALNGRFTLAGPSLAAVGQPVGVTLPTTGAFASRGRVVRQGGRWQVGVEEATVGSSDLSGDFSYDAGRPVPLLSGRLNGRRLMLMDLGPVVGTKPVEPSALSTLAAPLSALAGTVVSAASAAAALVLPTPTPAPAPALQRKAAAPAPTHLPGRVLPSRPLDLASLRGMDADVAIDIAEVDLNTRFLEPLRPLRGRLRLAGGVLTLDGLESRTADGRLAGEIRLDGRGSQALWTADLRWTDVRLERWVRQPRAAGRPPFVSGRLGGRALLQGRGLSTSEILGDLQGSVRTDLREGAMSRLAAEMVGLDVAGGLKALFKGDDPLPLNCGVADLAAGAGVLRPRVMVLDSAVSALWIEGSVSLATEALDLRVLVSPKDFSSLSLRSPLRVGGTFADPRWSLDKGPMARKLGAALLLALLNPLAALVPLVDPGDAAGAAKAGEGCRQLVQHLSASAPR